MPKMTSSQIAEAHAYALEEPWDEERADLRVAIGWALLANINRDSKKRPKPFTYEEFMPYRRHEPERPAPLWARIKGAFAIFKNGADGRPGEGEDQRDR